MPFGLSLDLGPSAPPPKQGQSSLSLAWADESGQTVSVRFDVVSSETHQSIMTLTDHPVEVGANVTDNARANPEQITIVAFVSNKPLNSNPQSQVSETTVPLDLPSKPFALSLTTLTAAVGDLLNPPPNSATVQRADNYSDRVRTMYETLTKARLDRALIRVVTAIEDLDSMLITSLGVPRNVSDGTGATFNVELKKIRLVSSELVDAPTPAEKRGQISASGGSKGSQKASDAAKGKGQSLLVSLGKGASILH